MKLAVGPDDPVFQFGPFVMDLKAGRLSCGDDDVPLTRKAFQVLALLIERRGQVVEKEEFFRQLWPGTFVEENNLARNVSMLRKALHERDADHEYIVTVPGRGYRFIGTIAAVTPTERADAPTEVPVEAASAWDESSPEAEPARGPEAQEFAVVDRVRAWTRTRASALVAVSATIAGALIAGLLSTSQGAEHSSFEPKLWPFPAMGRLEGEPAWSPDGRFLAYSSDRSGNFDIWVQPIGEGTPVQVTTADDRDWQPAWSPDGQHIAFRSERDGGGLFVVPAFGGLARRISSIGYWPQWSPDGSRLLFSDMVDLARAGHAYVVSLDGTPPELVRPDVLADLHDYHVGWHPDGRVTVYGGPPREPFGLWTMDLDGGPVSRSDVDPAVRERLKEAGISLGGFVWAPSGDALYFEARSSQTEDLWRVSVDPRTLRWVAGPDRLTRGAGVQKHPVISADGKRLAFSSRTERVRIWSFPFDAVSGSVTGPGTPVTPAGADVYVADVSPDGRQLAYRVDRSGRQELWVRSLDDETDRLVQIEYAGSILQPRWSHDGVQLAYYVTEGASVRQTRAQGAVMLFDASGTGTTRAVSTRDAPSTVYDWLSDDRRALIVGCKRKDTGHAAICRLNADGPNGSMTTLATDTERHLYQARTSPDGRWISFIAFLRGKTAVYVVSADGGGPWIPITSGKFYDDKPRWSPDGRTLYFLSSRSGFWNLWGQRIDPASGAPEGQAFQITTLDTPEQLIKSEMGKLQIAVTRDSLMLPVAEVSGGVWILDGVQPLD